MPAYFSDAATAISRPTTAMLHEGKDADADMSFGVAGIPEEYLRDPFSAEPVLENLRRVDADCLAIIEAPNSGRRRLWWWRLYHPCP